MNASKLLLMVKDGLSRIHGVFKYIFSWIRLYWMVNKLPGPPFKVFPKFGHSHYIKGMLAHCKNWQREFPLCHKFYLSIYPTVIVYSPEAVQEVLSKKQKHNDKGNVYHAVIPLLGDGLISSKGEKWYRHRKMLTPAFHFNILDSFFEVFNRGSKKYIEELRSSSLLRKYDDICPYTKKLTLSFICETAMGTFLEEEKHEQEEILNAMHILEYIGTVRMQKPWLLVDFIYKKSNMFRKQEQYKKILHSFTNKLIKKRRAQIKERLKEEDFQIKKRREIFLDLLILQQLNGEQLSDNDIRDEVNTFIFAGHNTTQLAINYCLYLLGRHKDIQEKAIMEQDAIFGCSSRDPTIEDLNKMEYLGRCIKDSLRLFPSVPMLARRLTEDVKIGEYILPKEVDCLLMPFITHRISEQFPNPEEFNPDNFLPEKMKERHPYSYFPFSAGPRNCIGKRFANIAEKTVLSWFLRKFRIESKQRQEDLKLNAMTILVPKDGLLVKITPR